MDRIEHSPPSLASLAETFKAWCVMGAPVVRQTSTIDGRLERVYTPPEVDSLYRKKLTLEEFNKVMTIYLASHDEHPASVEAKKEDARLNWTKLNKKRW